MTEGEIYNYPEAQYSKALSKAASQYNKETRKAKTGDLEEEEEVEGEEEDEQVELESMTADGRSSVGRSLPEEEAEEEMEDEDEEQDGLIEYIEDFEESDDEEDIEDLQTTTSSHGNLT